MEPKENIHDCRVYMKYAPQYHFHKLRYSDDCDFSEVIIIFGLGEIMNTNIYLNGKKIELHSVRDLSLYYAFGVAHSYHDKNGTRCMELSYLDKNSLQIKLFGEYYIEAYKEYRQNWYEAIIANGFDEEFAWKWVYQQAYLE